MDADCENGVACSQPPVIKIDSPEPGGSIHLCATHAPRCTMLDPDGDRCEEPAVVSVESLGETCWFCAECATWVVVGHE